VAIIGHPQTGELLAVAGVERDEETGEMQLASSPLAVSDAYQAGSVFKLVTAAAAYEAGVVTATRQFTVPSSIQIDDATFTDAHEHPTEQMDVDRIVAESSNVGTIQMGLFVGKERLYRELEDFGFGRRTGVGHPAESEGQLPDAEGWTRPDLAAASIGTFQSTTPVQLWAAYNVIANGGLYVPPRLVSGTVDADGRARDVDTGPARRVVSASTAAEVDRALRRVVEQGTAKQWSLPGYPVAAKTGTSRIPSPKKVDPKDDYVWLDGRYHYVTTFAGYLPADRPQVSITVMLYDTRPDLSGSTSAGPVFSDLARMSIRELAIAPTVVAGTPTTGTPTTGTPEAGTPTAGTPATGTGRVRAVPAPAEETGSTRSGSASTTMSGSSGRTTSAGGTAAGAG
jgi:cell division protein FtsI (penicillin-binding protein 3)